MRDAVLHAPAATRGVRVMSTVPLLKPSRRRPVAPAAAPLLRPAHPLPATPEVHPAAAQCEGEVSPYSLNPLPPPPLVGTIHFPLFVYYFYLAFLHVYY
ncbi:hypothetical protein CEXT_68861 [Caerostris extrusa]|uniref:Uncharacterized protein n=1 Tax=Caerostris extrusa TaxID=172846 RepID=A0AAV4TEE5_CAEEX|nr:hypothetical protein CEXT_68861 [Caerostris extrusa]